MGVGAVVGTAASGLGWPPAVTTSAGSVDCSTMLVLWAVAVAATVVCVSVMFELGIECNVGDGITVGGCDGGAVGIVGDAVGGTVGVEVVGDIVGDAVRSKIEGGAVSNAV